MVDLSDKKHHLFKQSTRNSPYSINKKRFLPGILACILFVFLLVIWQSRDPLESEVETILSKIKPPRRCLRNIYKDFLLVVHFDEPYYKDNTFVRGLYENVFGKVLVCGPEPDAHSGRFVPDIEFESQRGKFGYACLGKAMEKYANYTGYFYSSYDVIINWWNLEGLDTQRIWMLENDPKLSDRPVTTGERKACTDYRTFLQRFANSPQYKPLLENFRQNTFNAGAWECKRRPSRFFYVPKKYLKNYSVLSYGSNLNQLEQHSGPINIIQSLVDSDQIVEIQEYYRPPQYRAETSPLFWADYTPRMTVAHSYRLYRKNQLAWMKNLKMVKEKYFKLSSRLVDC